MATEKTEPSETAPAKRASLRESSSAYMKLLVYLKPHKWLFIAGMIFGALYGAVQGLMIFTIKHVGDVAFPTEEKGPASFSTALFLCLAIPAVMTLRGACSYLNSLCMLKVSIEILNDIRNDVFQKVLEQSMSFFNTEKSGNLIQTVFGRTRMAQMALTKVASDIIKQPIAILSALAALFYIDWRFTLGSLILFPLCLLPMAIVSKRVRQSGGDEEKEAGGLMVLMQEAFAGIRLVKSNSRESYEAKRFATATKRTLKNMLRWRAAIELVGPLVEIIASFGVGAALMYAWYFDLGAARFIALNGGLLLLYPPFKAISQLSLLMQKCVVATDAVFAIMEREPDIQDAPGAKVLENCRGDIRFEDVYFKYPAKKKAKKPAVKGLTLNIPAGTTCALVGSSGAGKSTLLSLLLRLYDPQRGRVFIDGVDVREYTQESLRENISVVSQDTFLFHDKISTNIRYGKLDATNDEIEKAARLAHIHDFIVKQPDGYDTIVGDKGCMLSGGQQQRVSIARALLKDAPILLLDEATAALDSESEKHIQAALETVSRGRTVIAIAHRLSTILNADQIVVMAGGRVMDSGTHAELYETSPIYRKLYDLQFHSHELSPVPELAEPDPYSIP